MQSTNKQKHFKMREVSRASSYATTAEKNEKALAAEACNCKSGKVEVSSADMSVCDTSSHSIKTTITNNNANDIIIPIGTIYSIAAFASGAEKGKSFLGATTWYDNTADLVDNYGAGLDFVQSVNAKLFSKSAVISSIKVYTDDTALGLQQRQTPLTVLTVPLNVSDASSKAGSFVTIDLESNSAELLDKAYVVGDSHGLLYNLKAGATVDMELTLASQEVSKFAL